MKRLLTTCVAQGQRLICLLFALPMLSACDKADPEVSPAAQLSTNASYQGTFQRQHDGEGLVSLVTLTLANGRWSGQSSLAKYPALCEGTYQLSGDKITFQNTCAWTAEFDWTLILSGTYKVTASGTELELVQASTPTKRDIYRLTKQ